MIKRTVTGVIMAGLLFLTLWLVGLSGEYTLFIFDALVLFMGAMGTYEIYKAVKGSDNEVASGRRGYVLSAISLVVMCVITFPLTYFFKYMGLLFALIISFLIAFVFYIFDEKKTFSDFAANVFALFYPMGLIGVVFVMDRTYGMIPVLLGLGISLVSDAMAYWIGVLFGKKKIFPKISPKKTYAGCIGGIVGGTIGGVLVYLIFELANFPTYVLFRFDAISEVPYLWYALIGAILAFFSEIGDLAASRVKRSVGIKDYGKLLGAHGGVLDRIDSILFTVSIMAIIMEIVVFCV
ncbi:MAG: phosphatidate cytidylyltransferase [Clostridia bacterium]|nr:phosphatidate cytidylyltransferase [Clostridia bacterium]